MHDTRAGVFRLAIAAVERIYPLAAHWLRSLSGGSFQALFTRTKRLRSVAAGIARGSLVPPRPIRLQIETTDVCNLRCIHCTREVLDGMNTASMDLATFERIVADIDPYYVTMNGLGEPLIDKTVFQKLRFVHGRGVRSSMPTNGTYIRRHKRDELAVNLPDILQLSIDGATKESFEAVRKLADFDKTMENYRAICALKADGKTRPGTSIRILCAMQRANMNDYREMFRLYKSMRGADAFGAVPVFDYDADGNTYSGLVPSPAEVIELHARLDTAIQETTDEDERVFYCNWKSVSSEWLKTAHSNRIDPEQNNAPCAVPWFSTYIDAKRRVYPCCYLTASEHVMGRLAEDGGGFDSVWGGERYRSFRAALMENRPGVSGCRNCPRNDMNVLKALSRLGPLVTLGAKEG